MQPVDVQKQLLKIRRTNSGSVEQGYVNERQEIEDAEQSLARMVGWGSATRPILIEQTTRSTQPTTTLLILHALPLPPHLHPPTLQSHQFAVGGTAGVIETFIVQPLVYWKTMQQIGQYCYLVLLSS